MKLNRSFAILAAAALFATPLAAQNMKLHDVNGYVGWNGVATGPYHGQLIAEPGQPIVDIFCVDFNHEVTVGETWQANFTNLGSGDLSNTRWGSLSDAQQRYMEAAYLATQFAATAGSKASDWPAIHAAIWHIFTPNSPDPSGWSSTFAAAVDKWTYDAKANWGSINPNEWTIVSDVNLSDPYGAQEFLMHQTVTPEPATLILLGTGLALTLGIGVMTKRIA